MTDQFDTQNDERLLSILLAVFFSFILIILAICWERNKPEPVDKASPIPYYVPSHKGTIKDTTIINSIRI